MVMWESSQWLKKSIVPSIGFKNSRKAPLGALADAILDITVEKGDTDHSFNQMPQYILQPFAEPTPIV